MIQSFQPAAIFRDHMVLQREKPVCIWGTAPAEADVTVCLEQDSCSVRAGADGSWQLYLPAREAGGPFNMTLTCDGTTLTISDIMVGEVWLAGGQSNMELELQNCKNGKLELAACTNPLLRFYNVPKTGVIDPEAESKTVWKLCCPQQAADVSAVAYFAAKRLAMELGVTIGVIDCYQGGSSITCWMDHDLLASNAAGQQYLDEYQTQIAGKTDAQYQQELSDYNALLDEWNRKASALKEVEPEPKQERIDEVCGPFPFPPPMGRTSVFRPAGLYYTMLQRVCPYTLRGFWWYQGEQDAPRSADYPVLLTELIDLWRTDWHDAALPFAIVQLPMFISKVDADNHFDPLAFARQREQQEKVADTIPHTSLTVLTDCGEWNNIHPLDKQTVGRRLACSVLPHFYNRKIPADSPRVRSWQVLPQGVEITFQTDSPLCARGGAVAGFTLDDGSGVFSPACAVITGFDRVLVFCNSSTPPKAVRYAFADYCEATLYNEAGLPAACWRSDAD